MMHQDKVENLKLDVVEIRKKFDDRVVDLKEQLKTFESNNDQTDALKKKLAEHVRESNKKYSDLLQAKLDKEDEMTAKF